MLHALALAATIVASPQAPSSSPSATQPAPARPACEAATMDPAFVRYVPPPNRSGANPLLWLIDSAPPPTQTVNAFAPRPLLNCLHPLQVRDDR